MPRSSLVLKEPGCQRAFEGEVKVVYLRNVDQEDVVADKVESRALPWLTEGSLF